MIIKTKKKKKTSITKCLNTITEKKIHLWIEYVTSFEPLDSREHNESSEGMKLALPDISGQITCFKWETYISDGSDLHLMGNLHFWWIWWIWFAPYPCGKRTQHWSGNLMGYWSWKGKMKNKSQSYSLTILVTLGYFVAYTVQWAALTTLFTLMMALPHVCQPPLYLKDAWCGKSLMSTSCPPTMWGVGERDALIWFSLASPVSMKTMKHNQTIHAYNLGS